MTCYYCAEISEILMKTSSATRAMTSWTQEPARQACTYVLSDIVGVLRSPNYPTPYPHPLSCWWQITKPDRYSRLEFEVFDVGEPIAERKCISDFVLIQIREQGKTVTHGPYCGQTTPGPLNFYDEVNVTFVANGTGEHRGFYATYGPDPPLCSYVVAGLVGELKSPTYPQFYTNIQNCSWKIERPTTPSVTTKNTQKLYVGQKCPSDFVVIRVGRGPLPQMYGPFCGAATPAPVYFQDVLFMNLTIKGTGDHRGFRATFGPGE
ncbi:Cubilin [Clonorchis sinensis]|uniref:Cubilin n=1 Tax=Clonorchis sinensis TaxID=79923 RepID=A0A419PN65_CLOSI|nr:Cubilin [Clonorchis sinensis]